MYTLLNIIPILSPSLYYFYVNFCKVVSLFCLLSLCNVSRKNNIFGICALLGYYAALSNNPLPTFRDNLSVPSSRVKNSKKVNNICIWMRYGHCRYDVSARISRVRFCRCRWAKIKVNLRHIQSLEFSKIFRIILLDQIIIRYRYIYICRCFMWFWSFLVHCNIRYCCVSCNCRISV